MIRERCRCGWPKPLIAFTTATGELPRDALRVRVLCPECNTAYTAGERSREIVTDDELLAAAGAVVIDLRKIL